MQPKRRIPTPAGEILLREFLEPLGVEPAELAEHLNIPTRRVNEIVRGKRGISSEMAWLLSAAFGTTPEFWMNLQSTYDLAISRPARSITRLKRTG